MGKTPPPEIEQKEQRQHVSDESFYKNIANGGPCLNAVITGPDMRLSFVNKQFEHYLGYTNEDVLTIGICLTDIVDKNQQSRLVYQLGTVMKSIEAQSSFVIYHLKHKDGKIAPYFLFAAPVNDEDGNGEETATFHITLNPDKSKWDMPFTSFATKEVFLEHFNSEDFGTFEWLIEIDKVFWSKGVYGIYEVDYNKDINPLLTATFLHPEDRERVIAETNRVISTGGILDMDYRIVTGGKKVKILHCFARIIKSETGKMMKLAGSLRDVTGQRAIEEDLKRKVKELFQSNQELEEFAYIASHDMQEPLRKIITFSDRLSDKYKEVLTGDGAMYLSRMITAAGNMRNLINDLLDFSRITKTAQLFEPVDLEGILRQVKNELELNIEETGTEIRSEKLPVIDAIPSQMKQLFLNIICNSIKFRRKDVAPVLAIKASTLSEMEKLKYEFRAETVYHKIEVADNGIGFEEEYALRIFQVFQRLHGKSEYPGSGIGLAICKKITEYHHGAIYAENVEGVGAVFIFILPQHQVSLKK
jgi:signal transduction histidine kinase